MIDTAKSIGSKNIFSTSVILNIFKTLFYQSIVIIVRKNDKFIVQNIICIVKKKKFLKSNTIFELKG